MIGNKEYNYETPSKSYVGVKYFREIEDDTEIIRVVNDKDPSNFKCKPEGSNNNIRMSKKKLLDEYTRLTPDGIIYFNIVDVGEIQDVMIMMYRREDIEKKSNTPYIICRQNITDLFANTINPDYNNLIVGLAISEKSRPEKVPMETLLACDGVKKICAVNIYMDDTLDSILKMIKSKDYDNVLTGLFVDHIRYKYEDDMHEYLMKRVVDGYSKNLRCLMEDNEFMYEFYTGFNIYPVNFTITEGELEKQTMLLSHSLMMSTILMRKIISTLVIPYDKSIDLKRIERDYALIVDKSDKIYIVAYTYNGNMEVPVADIETEENIAKMANIPGYANNKDVLNALRFNTSKYQ